jgi:hypothetical protein
MRFGDQSPSIVSSCPPRTMKRPPCFSIVSRAIGWYRW